MMIFKRILDKNDNILVPRVYKRLSSSEVLTIWNITYLFFAFITTRV
jgi:predicted unusual protein kinase regulating ubiquinone biosynthesis (AarF/ABC1/UbiB family)